MLEEQVVFHSPLCEGNGVALMSTFQGKYRCAKQPVYDR